MKQIIYTLLLILFCTPKLMAQSSDLTCNLGFVFEISNDRSWGYGEPVIVNITPGSPAEKAGLKLNDIILEVNDKGTYLQKYETIMSWFGINETEMDISIRNMESTFKEMVIAKDCRRADGITEAQLAPVFAFYSLEDVQDRRFIMPVKTKTNEEAQYHNYRTFSFAPSDESTRELDERINAIFTRALQARGLRHDEEDPDFIIQTFYSYESNSAFKPESPTLGSYQPVWRFDMRNKRMVKIPVYNPSEAVRIDDIPFNVEFGYRFYDRKFVQPGEMTLMWESEIKERLSGNYGLIDYLEMNLPLMLQKFPYAGSASLATYQVKSLKYNYTGLSYNMNDLKTVVYVDPGSPAAFAGIRYGDVVNKIGRQNFNHTSQSLTEGYRRFLAETMNYRDKSTRYTDSNGFQEAMYWDVTHYNSISKAIGDNKRYKSGFSYLFNFNQYVDWTTPRALEIEVIRDGEKIQVEVVPQIKNSLQILTY